MPEHAPLTEPRRLTIPCARCGRTAVEVALLPASTPEQGPPRLAKDRLVRSGFLGLVHLYQPADSLPSLYEAIASGDYAAARSFDSDFVAYHCRACGQAYCQRCWRLDPPVFDDIFYDYTEGTCPAGHRQMVDD